VRRIRRWVVAAVVLLGALAALDRGGAYLASRAVADRIQAAEHLSDRPEVDISGIPFLTQVVGGRYDHIRVTFTGLVRGGVRVARLEVDLRGAHVPFRAILGGHVGRVPVDSGSAVLTLTYADLDASLVGRALKVSYGGTPGTVRLAVDGLSTDTSLAVHGDTLSGALVGPFAALGFSRTLSHMPFGVQLTQVTSGPQGITIGASATSFTIPA
jgi:LmeA-like phospholipid-binding